MKYFGGLVAALILAVITGATPVAAANLNNFVISNYQVDMTLGRDAEGHSTLKTVETITAEFPSYDQNHGLVRAIPKSYNGHTVSLSLLSVTDENGRARDYSTSSDNGNMIITAADPSMYVHGTQVYVFTYTQYDVTKYFSDTNDDEFYWDINGTEWKVPIQRLDTRITLADGIEQYLTGNMACYEGATGSTQRCEVDRSGGVISSSATGLGVGENISVAIGFDASTFAEHVFTSSETVARVLILIQIITGVVAVGILIWLSIAYDRLVERSKELKPIPPEYLPPTGVSVTTASQLAKTPVGSIMSAQLLDFAVRHYIRFYEVAEKTWYRKAEYEIEIVKDLSGLAAEERELLSDAFGGALPAVGARLNLKTLQNNQGYRLLTMDNDKKLRELIMGEYAFRDKTHESIRRLKRVPLVLVIVGFFTASLPLLFMALVSFVALVNAGRLTDKGLTLRRHLEGLKLYIHTAEAERIRMLQSPEGAEKVAAVSTGTDQKSLVKLYERVLPYAVLFGDEKEWTRQLGLYYEQAQAQPEWYSGRAGFNAAVFSSAMSGISSATYATSSSSSTGGSSGGGSSGGGGGGGGGGGA